MEKSNKPLEDMTPEELKEYEESLNKEIKFRELKKKQESLDSEVAEEGKKLEEEKIAKWESDRLEQWYKDNPDKAPVEKIPVGGEAKGNQDNKFAEYYTQYCSRNEKIESKSGYEGVLADAKSTVFQIYKNQRWQQASLDELWINTDSDTGCEDDVSAWSPDDIYAKMIWETFVCKADLFKIAVKGISINPGDGLGVQIRAFGAFGDPTELASCECASCASITFTTYPLTLKQYNLEAIVCDKDIWDVGGILMDAYIKSMSDSWARWFDAQIYSEIETATPGTTATLPAALNCTPAITGSCCTDAALVNLYNAVHQIVASMREGTGLAGPYDPDYVIVSPTVAAIFKRMQTPTPMPWMGDITFDASGRLKSWAGLKVIEYCGANTCTNTSAQEVAIVIDSRRAVGAVFGQRPKTYKFFQSNCNSYRIDQWAYFAVGELDTDAIAHVVNP